MFKIRTAIASVFCTALVLLISQPAAAQTRTVVADVPYLKTHDLSGNSFITVTCYDSTATQCAGGGDFDLGPNCVSPNDATMIQDAKAGTHNCFYRKNFGLNGTVDARQCGVRGDGATNDYSALNTCLNLAASSKIPVVQTGGGQVIVSAHDVTIPTSVELSCGGYGTATDDNDDYRLASGLPNVLVVDPGHTVSMPNPNATFSGCNLLVSNASSNVFSPTTYYPNCTNNSVPCTESGNAQMRSALNEYSAFTGTGPAAGSIGISVAAENTLVRDVTVLGFGTCYSSFNNGTSTGKRHNIDHLIADCDTGIKVDSDGGSAQFDNYIVQPFLTRQNGTATTVNAVVDAIGPNGTGAYKATVEVLTTGGNLYRYAAGDTVWIGTSSASHAESAAGRWIVGSDVTSAFTGSPCAAGKTCQTFTLKGWGTAGDSVSSPLTGTGDTSNVPRNGQPTNLIANVSVTRSDLISVGQVVSDSASCIPSGAKVKDVWPAKGIVWLDQAATCVQASDSLTFTDGTFVATSPTCADGSSTFSDGCATTSSALRFGDGVVITNTGGVRSKSCTSFEHAVAFHLSTGSNSAEFTDCGTGEDERLPDRGVIGLLIDGDHTATDACGPTWQGGPLGQHRPVVILMDTNCPRMAVVTDGDTSSSDTNESGVTAEVRSGSLSLVAGGAASSGNILFSSTSRGSKPNRLFLSNNQMDKTTLYLADAASGAAVTGCGNVLAGTTPYQCSPPVAVDLPRGRLTLTSGVPVMTTDAVNATVLYYAPYQGQTVPVFNSATNVFDQVDIGSSGINMNLNGTAQTTGHVYDVFVDTADSGAVELCTGPAWTSTTARSAAIQQVDGIWVNATTITCQHFATNFQCPAFMCTYVGSMYATGNGKTAMQFGPNSHAGGNGNCLCLYNAYNRVPVVSASLDSNAAYTYTSTTWRAMDNSGGALNGNSISVLDGLGQSSVDAKAEVLLKGNTATPNAAKIGVDLNSTSATPAYVAQNADSQSTSTIATLRNPPVFGLWYAQGMEATSTGANALTFGGPGSLQISVNVDD